MAIRVELKPHCFMAYGERGLVDACMLWQAGDARFLSDCGGPVGWV